MVAKPYATPLRNARNCGETGYNKWVSKRPARGYQRDGQRDGHCGKEGKPDMHHVYRDAARPRHES